MSVAGPCVSVVTGASSGIGRATAIYLAQQGHVVYGTVRSTSRLDTFHRLTEQAGVDVDLVEVDVADDESVTDGFRRILDATGRVDVLVNNAGVGANAVAEEATADDYLAVMNVNLGGAIRCLKHVLPGMRERRSGTVVNVSSMVGRVAAIAQSPYVASKYAMEGVSEGLAQELAPFGIRVVIIEPGVTKTSIFAKGGEMPNSTGAYATPYRRLLSFYRRGISEASDPREVAAVIHEAIETTDPRLRYVVGWGARQLIEGRQAMTDDEWVALGGIEDDATYRERFAEHFAIDIASPDELSPVGSSRTAEERGKEQSGPERS